MPAEPSPPPPRRAHPLRLAGRALVVLAGLALIALLAYGLIARAPNTTIDDNLSKGNAPPAPGFDLPVLQPGDPGVRLTRRLAAPIRDGRITLRELRGVPVVVNFWASWCLPCRVEATLLQQTWLRVARPSGVLLFGIDMQDVAEDARANSSQRAFGRPRPARGSARRSAAPNAPPDNGTVRGLRSPRDTRDRSPAPKTKVVVIRE